MENEAGSQVVTYTSSAYFSNPFSPGRFYDSSQQTHGTYNQAQKVGWNANSWDWDSVLFIAKPTGQQSRDSAEVNANSDNPMAEPPPGILRLGTKQTANPSSESLKRKYSSEEEDAGNLTLKLGGSSYADDSNSKNNKRLKSGNSAGSSYPVCQVDNCRTDLTSSKDYHRRHKVCELHSKASRALVANVMQRFCQQCSRFHPLPEFDEGKRSCRRRLAGHNRRRRKTQSEEMGCRGSLAGDDNGALRNVDIVSVIGILSQQLQVKNTMDKSSGQTVLDRDYLVQCLNKLNSMSSLEDFSRNTTRPQQAIDLNVAQDTQLQFQGSNMKAQMQQTDGPQSPVLNADMLRILSTLTERSPEALSLLNKSLVKQHTPQTLESYEQQFTNQQLKGRRPNLFVSGMVNGKKDAGIHDGVLENCTSQSGLALPLQLFDCSENDCHLDCGALRQHFTTDSLDPLRERASSRSPSSAPPVVQKLFPLHSTAGSKENDSVSVCKDDLKLETRHGDGGYCNIGLSKGGSSRDHQKAPLSSPHRGLDPGIHGYTSSGSDQSPASSNSDSQERTGRIIFKLFGKDPSNFPQMLRSQILEWLSHSPSDMESYIRPGCVILTVFASMPSTAWEQLREDLQERLKLLLIKDCSSNFWRNGRIIVEAERHLVSFKDGRIRLCKSWRSWNAPEIHSIQPIAVVAGEETNLTLRGHNLTAPGTKILCAYRGKYTSQKVVLPEEHQMGSFFFCKSTTIEHKFSGGPANVLGRCFIEVEQGLKGNSFPVIVADNAICRELRSLESDIEGRSCKRKCCKVTNGQPKMHLQEETQLSIQNDAITFLNELGWLFQRISHLGKEPISPKFSPARFKFLLTYSVERDWTFLLRRVLDIFFSMHGGQEGSLQDSWDVLLEINLLHRAVKRNCRQVVDLLLCYRPSSIGSSSFVFSPDSVGPGGLTPLHLAASMQDAEDIVDALTSDPQEIGLQAWTAALDANQQTPHAYALMRNNHSYNRMVGRKLADRISAQVSITIWKEHTSLSECPTQGTDGMVSSNLELSQLPLQSLPQSCARCVRLRSKSVSSMAGNQGALYRPFVHSLLAVAAVCVCVCLLFKGPPRIGSITPFKWENVNYGAL
eukprot:Gb_41517 [translate_table: standard]